MAHIVVYLQRTSRGLHPGSLGALCAARDVADNRGASVLGVCLGDAGAFDDRIIVEASRVGADQLVFAGPEGITKLVRRLAPRHVFAAYTREAIDVLESAGVDPMTPRWIDGPLADVLIPGTVIGVVAGGLPWHDAPLQVEPEYEADVTQVELAPWLVEAAAAATNLTKTVEQPPLVYIAPEGVEADVKAALESLGAYASEIDKLVDLGAATALWFDDGNGLPEALGDRSPGVRVVLLTDGVEPSDPIDSSWVFADLVLTNPAAQTVREFNGQAWKTMFA